MALGQSLLASLAVGALASPAFAESPEVVASIKPIHSLVAGVMRGVGEPTLLIEGAGSPHTYSLRPSEARAIAQADVVFWVGEGLEAFLAGPLATLAPDARLVALAAAPSLTLLPTRSGGMWQEDHHDEQEGEEADHDEHDAQHEDHAEEARHGETEPDHGHGASDMHVWLDPQNAKTMVDTIAATLAETDPDDADTYERNAVHLREDLDRLDRRIAETLSPVVERPFVVFHDGYQYFERRYGLNAIGSISVGPDRRPGARRLEEIRDTLEETDAACVFAEPQFEPALVATVTEGTSARAGVLDPLGAELDEGPDQYAQLLESLAGSLVDCLGAPRSG
jgi:zinc transport system substrate-binding protein